MDILNVHYKSIILRYLRYLECTYNQWILYLLLLYYFNGINDIISFFFFYYINLSSARFCCIDI
eukprot:UN13015